ncbi:MAG: hypothetical protein AAF125_18670 [Chloroflexota bacterium]
MTNLETHKAARRPLIDPLLLALKSRRVLIALTALAVSLLVSALPALASVHTELLIVVTTLALALIGGYTAEDAARAARDSSTEATLNESVKAAVTALTDELLTVEDKTP